MLALYMVYCRDYIVYFVIALSLHAHIFMQLQPALKELQRYDIGNLLFPLITKMFPYL